MEKQVLKSSAQWQLENPQVLVLDPDGWDRKNFDYSWGVETISYEEYEKRVNQSTVRIKLNNYNP